MYFGELITAMVTPFTETGDAIDYDRTEALVEHLISTGSDGLVVSGTTGESPTLSHEEKLSLFRFVKEVAKKRVQVLAGTSSNDTRASIQLSKEAESLGVDGLLLVTPYYSRPSQEGLYQHFKVIANEVKIPCMLYNVPSRTSVNLDPETQVRLADLENVVATKEAGTADQLLKLVSLAPSKLRIYTGDDKMLLPTLSLGGTGVVSVTAHVIGPQMKALIGAFQSGDVKRAAKINQMLMPVFEGMMAPGYPNPTLVKACLAEFGIPCGPLRLPLVDPDDIGLQKVIQTVNECKASQI